MLGILLLPLLFIYVKETLNEANESHPEPALSTLLPLVKGRRISTSLLWLASFLILLISYFLINWIPTILALAGLASEHAMLGGVIFNLGGVLGALVLTYIFSYRSTFNSIGLFLLGGAFIALALGFYVSHAVLVIPLVFLSGVCVIGGQLNLPALAAHIFPLHSRASGIGWTMGIGRVGSIVGPSMGGLFLDQNYSWILLFSIISLMVLITAVAIFSAGKFLPAENHE